MRMILGSFFLIICSSASAQSASGSKHGAGSHSGGGRFQLIQLSDFRSDQFLIDTETGKIWQPVCTKLATDGSHCDGSIIFEEVFVDGISKPRSAEKSSH